MKKLLLFIALMPLMVFGAIPEKTNKFVNDYTNILSSEYIESLEYRLRSFSDSTSNQICVVIVNSFDGYEPWEYAQRLGQSWGVGTKEHNNGVIILIKPKVENEKGSIFISTGYGAEGCLPDATCKSIIEHKAIPRFKNNDYEGAINCTIDAIIPILKNEYNEKQKTSKNPWACILTLIGICIIAFVLYVFFDIDIISNGGGFNGSNNSGSTGSFFGGGSFGGGGAGSKW